MDHHQDIMNEAYDMWQAHEDWTLQDFYLRLSFEQRVAVMAGNLNYQVENGGFSQWCDNGYGDYASDLLRILEAIGTEACESVAKLVRKVNRAWTAYNDQSYSDSAWHVFYTTVDPISDQYYALSQQFLEDVEAFLIKGV